MPAELVATQRCAKCKTAKEERALRSHEEVVASFTQVALSDYLDDLDAVCAAFRRAHGHRLRIATKYHRLTREFLRSAGVADYLLVDSQGATEGTVRGETAEAVADITSTGETLRANGLKVLRDGLIHASQATLFLSRMALWGEAETAALARLKGRLAI